MAFRYRTHFLIAVAILGLCNAALYRGMLFSADEGTTAFPAEFPSRIGEWRATDVVYDPEVLSVLVPDRIVYKTYQENGSLPVTLFLACYGTLEKADFSHSPIVCFTGQGWEISETSVDQLAVPTGGKEKIDVNRMVQDKLNTKMISLHWYQSAHRSFTNRGLQKISLFFRSLLGRSDKNAFVRITAVVPRDGTVRYTRAQMHRFVEDLYPELRRYLQ
jgi:EpsI family protein